jgi:hypothetical protein
MSPIGFKLSSIINPSSQYCFLLGTQCLKGKRLTPFLAQVIRGNEPLKW